MRQVEKRTKPSRGHTRASTMATEAQLSQSVRNQMQLMSGSRAQGSTQGVSASQKDLFKLKKFKTVSARVNEYHSNLPSSRRKPPKEMSSIGQ